MSKNKYVVLEHLLLPDKGLRFWTSNTDNNTKIYDGTTAYKEILFTSNTDEAINACRNCSPTATFKELEEYWKEYFDKRRSAKEDQIITDTDN